MGYIIFIKGITNTIYIYRRKIYLKMKKMEQETISKKSSLLNKFLQKISSRYVLKTIVFNTYVLPIKKG